MNLSLRSVLPEIMDDEISVKSLIGAAYPILLLSTASRRLIVQLCAGWQRRQSRCPPGQVFPFWTWPMARAICCGPFTSRVCIR